MSLNVSGQKRACITIQTRLPSLPEKTSQVYVLVKGLLHRKKESRVMQVMDGSHVRIVKSPRATASMTMKLSPRRNGALATLASVGLKL
jgi:hypothetical protein